MKALISQKLAHAIERKSIVENSGLEHSSLAERLRANWQAAGIPATDADLQAIVAGGFFDAVTTVRQAAELLAGDGAPDYLAAWAPADGPAATPSPSGVTASPAAEKQPIDRFATLGEIAPLLHSRQLSPVELTEQALARIETRDPVLNAFQLVLADRALSAARRAEREIAAGDYRGPLHGVPVAVKDLLAMTGTITAAGSKVMGRRLTDANAAAVERLEAAGAVIVGKTRLSEFAYWPGSANPHYGNTANPWNVAHDTGGSSSGSAASVADGLVYAALGSDTGGSIRIPAALCGIVGLKPTFGRVSLYGCVPLAWSLDHLGPLTRSVGDAALLLAALAGPDARDPRTRPHSAFAVPANLEAGVKGLRIGVLRDDGTSKALGTDDALGAWHAALQALAQQGATLVEVDLPEMETLRLINNALLAVEAVTYHTPTLRAQLDDYGAICRDRLLRAFAYSAGDFVRAQQARQAIRRHWQSRLEQLDLLATPSQPDVAPALGGMPSVAFTNPFNALGWPAISVPAGLSRSGLPLAIQIVGKPWDEATVLRAARAVEVAQLMPRLAYR